MFQIREAYRTACIFRFPFGTFITLFRRQYFDADLLTSPSFEMVIQSGTHRGTDPEFVVVDARMIELETCDRPALRGYTGAC